MCWRTVEVDSWTDFRDKVYELCETSILDTAYRFRGQADSSWALESSLTRALGRAGEESTCYRIENTLGSEFHSLAPIHLPSNVFTALHENSSASVWWTVMQHFGAPTRLLDWSESPVIGAYFASEQLSETPGAVYAVDALAVHQSAETNAASAWNDFQDVVTKYGNVSTIKRNLVLGREENPDLLMFVTPKLRVDRMIAQKSAFSISNKINVNQYQTIENILKNKNFSHPPAIKFIIPGHVKYKMMDGLARINIGAHSLFPGLDGVGKRISEIAKFGKSR